MVPRRIRGSIISLSAFAWGTMTSQQTPFERDSQAFYSTLDSDQLRFYRILILHVLICFLALAASLCFGGSNLYLWDLFNGADTEIAKLNNQIFYQIRLPRSICGALVGLGLAIAGVLTQGLFRNSLASPSVLGVSSAGVLGALLCLLFGWHLHSFWATPLASLAFCFICMLILKFFAHRYSSMQTNEILLLGFALNAIFSALSTLILAISVQNFDLVPLMLNWMLGTLNGKTWEQCVFVSLPILVSISFAMRICYQLNLLSLGQESAESLGLDTRRLQNQTIALISILVAGSVSIGGLMPFVGLIVPHYSRLLVGPDHKKILLVSCFAGMSLILLADTLSRVLLSPFELQVGAIISVLGAPIFLWILIKRKN